MLYFPFLRVKKGEINALSTLKPKSKYSVRPILQIAPPDLDENGKKVKPSAEYITKIANTLQAVLNPSSNLACFLDPKPSGISSSLLRNLLFSITTNGGKFYPVYSLTGSEDYVKLYNSLLGEGKPYILRIPINELTGKALQKIKDAINAYELKATNAFILLDAGDISSPTTALGIYEVAIQGYMHQLSSLHPAGLILSSTSLPSIMPESEKWVPVQFSRKELEFFSNVKDGIEETIHFGDYATGTVSIEPSPSRIGVPKVRYTFPAYYEVTRGQKVGPSPFTMSEQFHRLSMILARNADFSGQDFSWGDEFIYNASQPGSQPRGNATTWVAVNTSHHLELVVSMLPSMRYAP
ncbi:hypothetical protein J0X19_21995 [Hymenobacter sp. BT186]|uniref:Beta protein n=1 Tax=Hymenobacter telluris TaxID=2816474 RepID=A0A939F021_9BACT|nr:hypothetical protein [Hymenobacter telluris]MBO0360648.1 hypothetical protein [Hymenobacter telluris]MBW3376675.1 beta family protein [Hymenobacter norwichensis]